MNFTCNTCSLSFPTPEDQRSHMKSDWHRYNLKRRVAQLPCIDEDLFIAKVASLTVEEDEPTNKKKGEKQVTKKEQRRKEREALQEQKRQILETARKAMMEKIRNGEIIEKTEEAKEAKESKKEVKEEDKEANEVNEQETKSGESSESPETKSDESSDAPEITAEEQEELWIAEKLANKVEVSPLTCLFSHPKYNKNFETIDENIEHMFKNFGLYIPEPSYLVDKEGLITYLGDKINFGFCIACNYQGKSAEAAREHMIKKRHMRIPYENEDEKLEISGFYDFSSTYDDVVPNTEEGDEGAWEDVSDEGEANENDEDDEDDLPPIDKDAIYQDGHELVLPSGAVIGHRSMARYYRQNLAPERILSEGQGTVIAAETRLMINARDRKELATQKRAWNNQKKREDVNDRRAAKFINNQPHFRDPLLQ